MQLTSGLDVAELSLWTFFLFFFGLVLYLRREDRREGYPLEDEITGELQPNFTFLEEAHAKVQIMPHGQGVYRTPNYKRDTRPVAARPSFAAGGAPLDPTGDPLVDGVGPAAWANRADHPDLNAEGEAKIIPIGNAPSYTVSRDDPDFRGWPVVGCDKRIAGTVTDLWVDTSDRLIRYFEVELAADSGAPGRRVLAPMFQTRIDGGRRLVKVDAIRSDQFARVPGIARPDQITLLEEDKIQGYFGGGWLYALPERQEPLV